MTAPKRTKQALQKHPDIRWELDRLEKAANKQIRKTLPQFRSNGEVAQTLLDDLAAVVSNNDWRPPLQLSVDRLRRAAKHIRHAVRLVVQSANGSPTYATIPSIVWESTPEAEAKRHRIAALPARDRLFGSGGAIESLKERERRRVVDPKKIAPNFLEAMLVYSVGLEREADRINGILKARDRRYDRLGPKLSLIRAVHRSTGKPKDAAVARLLTDAYEVVGERKQFSPDAIRKLREHHPASKP